MSLTDAYRIDDRLAKASFITTLDLTRGYWQVLIAWQPFGLQGTPATFQRMMDRLLQGLGGAYFDDLVHLRRNFPSISGKYFVWQIGRLDSKTTYVGHMVGSGMVRPELGKVDAVKSFDVPETKT